MANDLPPTPTPPWWEDVIDKAKKANPKVSDESLRQQIAAERFLIDSAQQVPMLIGRVYRCSFCGRPTTENTATIEETVDPAHGGMVRYRCDRCKRG